MNKLMLFMVIIIILVFMISFLIILVSKKSIIGQQKSTPFECGFNPMSYKSLPFSMIFFLIAVIFLIFYIEIIIIVPMIFTMKSSMLMYWLSTSTMFILILILGLFHEWFNGMLNWTN